MKTSLLIFVLRLVSFGGMAAFCPNSVAAVFEDRPNAILVLADDIGIGGFKCYGGDNYQTPHMDALARGGLRFEHLQLHERSRYWNPEYNVNGTPHEGTDQPYGLDLCHEFAVDFSDFFPTLAELARATLHPKLTIDGQSFAPAIRGRVGQPREWIYVQLRDQRDVRDVRWKLYGDGTLCDMKEAPFKELALAANTTDPDAKASRERSQAVLSDLELAKGADHSQQPVASANDAPRVPAFPGAEGFGAAATGGRGGKVLIVDSLADDFRNPAPGTFRWACETQTGPRVVVFRIGGVIELASVVSITNPDITIAAQTAPGEGICLKGSGLSIEASNVIVRGLRSRAGDGKVGSSGQNRRSLQIIGPVSDVILDHCTLGWGVDDDMNVYADKEGRAAKNFTIQWCFLTEGLHDSIHQQGPHSVAMTMGGGNIGPFSMHHNLLAHNNGRNPRIVWGAEGELIGNVIYNWGGEATIIQPYNPVKVRKDKRRPADEEMRPARLNLIGNSWIAGPSTALKRSEVYLVRSTEGTAIYFRDNVGPHRPAGTPVGQDEAAVMNKVKGAVAAEPAYPPSNVTVESAEDAKLAVLDFAGAVLPSRDAVDRRVAQEVREGKGKIIDSPSEVGGYPDYPPGTAAKDSDNDGMPDVWEEAHKLDKSKSNADGRDLDPIYDNIEVYVNGLFPTKRP